MSKSVASFTGDDLVQLYSLLIKEQIDQVSILQSRLKWKRVKVEKAIRFLRLSMEGKLRPVVNPFVVKRVRVDNADKFTIEFDDDATMSTTEGNKQ